MKVTQIHPPNDLFAAGWLEIVTDDGQIGQIDLAIVDTTRLPKGGYPPG